MYKVATRVDPMTSNIRYACLGPKPTFAIVECIFEFSSRFEN